MLNLNKIIMNLEFPSAEKKKYRILEFKNFFCVQLEITEYNISFFIPRYGIKKKWVTITKTGKEVICKDLIVKDTYQFNTKQECIEFLEDLDKYPIIHNL